MSGTGTAEQKKSLRKSLRREFAEAFGIDVNQVTITGGSHSEHIYTHNYRNYGDPSYRFYFEIDHALLRDDSGYKFPSPFPAKLESFWGGIQRGKYTGKYYIDISDFEYELYTGIKE